MPRKSEPIIEEFRFVDSAFNLTSELSDLVQSFDDVRTGKVSGKYRGVEVHSIRVGEHYIFAEAVIAFHKRTSKKEIQNLRNYATNFIEQAKKRSYSQDQTYLK